MKKNKFTVIGITFLLGAFFGISLFTVLGFVSSGPSPSPGQDLTIIGSPEANRYFLNYYDKAASVNERIKGFMVDRLQLEAMNNLINYDRTLTGFRIYMAKGDNNENIGIVVGVNDKFSDATLGRIYKTASANSGPCPFICDESSPITKGKD